MAMWVEHTAPVEATVMRLVVCEERGCEFACQPTVTGSGTSDSSVFSHGRAPEVGAGGVPGEDEVRLPGAAVPGVRPLPATHAEPGEGDKVGNLINGGVAGLLFLLAGVVFLSAAQPRPYGLPEAERFKRAEGETVPRAEFERVFRDKSAADYRKLCKRIDQGQDVKAKVAGQLFADLDQVHDERELEAKLPTGEPVRVQLTRKMKSGEKFTYEHDYKGRTVRFDYQLRVYTDTKERT